MDSNIRYAGQTGGFLARLREDAEIEVLFVIYFDQSKTDVIHHAGFSSIQSGRKNTCSKGCLAVSVIRCSKEYKALS